MTARVPNLILVGERRSGSTYFYHLLGSHPDVGMVASPDLDYFYPSSLSSMTPVATLDPPGDRAWDASHSPADYAARFREVPPRRYLGHKGANLLFWRPAHERMRRFASDAKLIAVLRNPIDRAWSQYWNEVGKGREPLDFLAALEAEEERASSWGWARLNVVYGKRGEYAASLRALFEVFPRSEVHVIVLERMRAQFDQEMRAVCDFLGIAPQPTWPDAPRNPNWVLLPRPWVKRRGVREVERLYARAVQTATRYLVRDRYKGRTLSAALQRPFRSPAVEQKITPAIRAVLARRFAASNTELEELLGYPIPEWRA